MQISPRPIRPLFRALAWVFGLAFAITGTASLGFAALAAVRGEWKEVWWSLPLALGGWGIAARFLPAAWTGLDYSEIEDLFEETEA